MWETFAMFAGSFRNMTRNILVRSEDGWVFGGRIFWVGILLPEKWNGPISICQIMSKNKTRIIFNHIISSQNLTCWHIPGSISRTKLRRKSVMWQTNVPISFIEGSFIYPMNCFMIYQRGKITRFGSLAVGTPVEELRLLII